jgi:perosamine synthetase
MLNIYEPNIIQYNNSAINAIKSGWISNHGEYVEKSAQKIKEFLNCKHAILMANGTCATHCLFLSLKFKHPEITKIYVPNNAYVAAWNAALMVYSIEQLEVMKMDIKTWNINTDEKYIKTLDVNSAVLIVHNLGNIVNVPILKSLRPDLIFVEDNCEGLFGKYNEIYSGTSDDSLCSSASFYGNKIITTGEGGVFLTQHNDIYEHIKKVYSQGMSQTKYLHDVHAYNYRMTNVQAGFLYDQLNDITNILENKKRIFSNYETLLDGLIKIGKVALFEKEENTEYAPWIFAVRLTGNSKTIEETTAFFRDNYIDIRPFFYPINKHVHLSSIENNDPASEVLNQEIIMIPSSPKITIVQQEKVVDVIYKFIFLNEKIRVTEINKNNVALLKDFIPKINSKYFRYFDNRSCDAIKEHKITLLFHDEIKSGYFGYTHIDYDSASNKYWFGIYLNNDYRGKGFGGLLLNYTLRHNNIKDITEIYLSVDVDNFYALKLYEKNNFAIYKSTDRVNYMKKITR